jgi:hypothetical protein
MTAFQSCLWKSNKDWRRRSLKKADAAEGAERSPAALSFLVKDVSK